VAGQPPLDPKTAQAVGEALGRWVIESQQARQVVIGMDTRESGPGSRRKWQRDWRAIR
jgi:phosphomannomutase